jgi:hypothetical protein
MRWYDWFLDEEEGTHAYTEQYASVQDGLEHCAWKALKGLVVDTRLWVGDETWLRYAKPVDIHHPRGQWFVEFTGQLRWVYHDQGLNWFDFVDNDTHTSFPFPLKAIVSYRSTGFPKVAYSSEKYVIGYVSILHWLDLIMGQRAWLIDLPPPPNRANHEHFYFNILPENLHQDVYTSYQKLIEFMKCAKVVNGVELHIYYDDLYRSMVRSMNEEMIEHNKPPYHHTIEWHLDARYLQNVHPFLEHYRALRKLYPSMIVGNGFIEIKR